MLEIFQYQFMVRAILAGSFVAVLLGWLGTFIIARKMSFMGDGIAHSSLAGIALALLLGWAPIPTAVMFAIVVAICIYLLESKTKISTDVAIGIMFTTGMAIGVILLHFYQGYQPELISYLFGNILTINNFDLWSIIITGAIVLILIILNYNKLVFTTFDREGAYLSGINPWIYDLLLYIITAVSIVLSIKLVGIVLVSALLITPSAFARLYTNSFKSFTILAVLVSVLIVVVGLILSYYLDLPSGATIILTGTGLFLLGYIFKFLKK